MQKNSFGRGLKNKALLSLLVSLALAGCGGGGGGGNGGSSDGTSQGTSGLVVMGPADPVTVVLHSDLDPSCTGCSAVDKTTYSGTGVGVWHKKNTGTSTEDMKVAIGGLSNKTVTLIFTNEKGTDVAMPSIAMSSSMVPSMRMASVASSPLAPADKSGKEKVEEFNRVGWRKLLGTTPTKAASASKFAAPGAPQKSVVGVVGATRAFNYHDGSSRATTLKKKVTLADGAVVQFWVETTEATEAKVSTALVDGLAATFTNVGGIYDMLKDTGGPLWGSHLYPELISDNQPIDIVVMNFVQDAQPFGEVGYFHSLNNFTQAYAPASNESVSLYLDAETLYLGGPTGVQMAMMTLAHEGMHMSNFYRRGVKMDPSYQYDTWLEEMTAMMMEDAASNAIDPSYNPIREIRFPQYLNYGSYNCALKDFTGFGVTCESYSVSGSFGGFLLRQLGMPFFQILLTQPTTDSEAALQSAITAYRAGSNIGEELRKFAVGTIPALPAGQAPAGFNFPARADGQYFIPGINAQDYKAFRVLPSSVPPMLKGYANFPVVRNNVYGNFQETVRVPPGTTLSVVVN